MHISVHGHSGDNKAPSLKLLKKYDGEVGQSRNLSDSDREQDMAAILRTNHIVGIQKRTAQDV